jgi:transcriptional regulator with XRE-family HTH domain
MTTRATMAHLSALIKTKRKNEDIGLREAAEKAGVSASTLSRLERGISSSLPDFETITSLAKWLDVPVSSVLSEKETPKKKNKPEIKTPEQIEVYLRADKNLSPETADALYKSFRILYDQFANKENKI